MNVYSAISERRSIRKYKDAPIEKIVIEELVRSATMAPSAKNRQPWEFIVLQNETKEEFCNITKQGTEKALSDTTKGCIEYIKSAFHTIEIMRQAPVIIVVLNNRGKSPWLPIQNGDEHTEEIYDNLSIGAAIQNMLLRATEFGLGTLWIADVCYAHDDLQKYLETEYQIASVIAVGYKDESPECRPRKSIDSILKFKQ